MKQNKLLIATVAAMTYAAGAFGNGPIGSPVISEFPINSTRYFIPASFTKEGKPMLTFSNFDSTTGDTELTVVDASLRKVAELDIPANPDALDEYKRGLKTFTMHWTSVKRDTLDKATFDLKAYLTEHKYDFLAKYCTESGTSDGAVYGNNDTSYEVLPSGFKAIKQFLIEAKEYVLVTCEGDCNVTTSVDIQEQTSRYATESIKSIPCYDYDRSGNSMGWISATQTLFNDDADFEYISPIFKVSSTKHDPDVPYYGYLYDFGDFAYSDSEYYVRTYPDGYTGFAIKNRSGDVLQTVSFEDGLYATSTNEYFMSLILIGGQKYISCALTDGKSSYTVLYAINKEGTTVKQVASFKTNVHPTVVDRGGSVQVETDSSQTSPLSIEAYDMSGKVLYKGKLDAGEGSMAIPASRLSSGLNVVTVSDGQQTSSTKVLVK